MAEQGGREADDASKPAGTASIELYGAASCPFTTEAREQLEYEGRDFIEYDVERDASAFVRLAKLLGDTKPMVPVVVENGSVKSIGRQGRGCYVNRP